MLHGTRRLQTTYLEGTNVYTRLARRVQLCTFLIFTKLYFKILI